MYLKYLFIVILLFVLVSCNDNKEVMPVEISLTNLIYHSDEFWGKTVVTFGYSDIQFAEGKAFEFWLYPSEDQSKYWDRTSLITIEFVNAEARKRFIEGCNNTYVSIIGRYVDSPFNGGRTLVLLGY
ncbi:MAG: hypothetical protein L3J46_09445, partial [Kangiellaceae bacterium]|nr:hypothetical protein [Kangiellaceae bacterium]